MAQHRYEKELMQVSGPMKISVPCGSSFTIPANTNVEVEVTCGSGGPQGIIPPVEVGLPRPELGALQIMMVTPAIEIDPTENLEEAIKSRIIDLDQIPSGSTLVIGTEAGSLDPGQLGRLAEEVDGLRASGTEFDAEIQIFEAER